MLLALVANNARLGIGDFAAARQLKLQKSAVALERDRAGTDNTAAFPYRRPGGAVDGVPEFHHRRMGRSPLAFELLDFGVGEFFRLEFAPGIEAAHKAEGEIADLADAPLRAVLRVGAGRERGRFYRQ